MATAFRQLNFSAGELAPSYYARVDYDRYAKGLRTLRNMYVMRSGGARNRSGLKFAGEVRQSSAGKSRLIPFLFAATASSDNYVIELSDNVIRFYQNGAQVLETATVITGITQASPAVVTTSAAHGYSNGQEVYITGVVGMTQVNGRNFRVAGVTATTFQLQYLDAATSVNSTGFTAYASAGTAARVYTVASPWDTVDLPYLKYVQNADVMTVVFGVDGANNFEYEIRRTAHTSWSVTAITYAPTIAAVTSLSHAPLGGGADSDAWVVTAVDAVTGEESLGTGVTNDSGAYAQTLTWSAVAGASKYNIYYRTATGLVAYWIAESTTSTYVHTAVGTPPQVVGRIPPQTAFGPLDTFVQVSTPVGGESVTVTDNHGLAVGYFQQRAIYGKDESVSMSWVGRYKSFWVPFSSIPDTAPILFSLISDSVSYIRHFVDVGRLLVFTESGVWVLNQSNDTILKPTNIDARKHTDNGSSQARPVIVGDSPIYVQSQGSVVRDLFFDYQVDGYKGNDLTQFANHLVDGHEITEMALQRTPDPVVWMVRSDGVLLSLSYNREQQMVAWAKHDTDGLVESVCVIPEGTEHSVYVVVKRTIDGLSALGGTTRRYIERMTTRRSIVEPKSALTSSGSAVATTNAVFLDSFLSFDGRNTNSAHTMTLSGGTTWVYTENLTLTSSAAFFASTDVGNSIFLYTVDSTGAVTDEVRCSINAFTNTTTVTVNAHKTVPTAFRGVAINSWARAVDELGGLWHLEGESLAVIGDDYVVANPNNGSGLTVANGTITLPEAYAVIHAGLPYVSDLETLDIDFVNAETRADKKKLINKVTVYANNSRGIWAGHQAPTGTNLLEDLREYEPREGGYDFDDPATRLSGPVEILFPNSWNSNGRVFLRQVDPVPMEILAVVPTGWVP